MGFFEKISRSPREKKIATHFKEQDRKAQAELQPSRQILPEVKSLTLSIFQLCKTTDSDWYKSSQAFVKYKDVAKKANSTEDLRIAAQGHCLSYAKHIHSLPKNHPHVSSFSNLTYHWWEMFEDLRDMNLVSKYISLEPNEITDIVEALSEIDTLIISKFKKAPELEEWKKTRENLRIQYPELPSIKLSSRKA
jgi:hypothetical protein